MDQRVGGVVWKLEKDHERAVVPRRVLGADRAVDALGFGGAQEGTVAGRGGMSTPGGNLLRAE
jgi:hypothetical protein